MRLTNAPRGANWDTHDLACLGRRAPSSSLVGLGRRPQVAVNAYVATVANQKTSVVSRERLNRFADELNEQAAAMEAEAAALRPITSKGPSVHQRQAEQQQQQQQQQGRTLPSRAKPRTKEG